MRPLGDALEMVMDELKVDGNHTTKGEKRREKESVERRTISSLLPPIITAAVTYPFVLPCLNHLTRFPL